MIACALIQPWRMTRRAALPCACQRHGGRSYAQKEQRPSCHKIVLKLPDLDHAKFAVLNSLSSHHSRRNYKFAMAQFITWYCSEPRLALNRTVVLRFRLYLESLGLAAGTVNQRLIPSGELVEQRSSQAAPGNRRRRGSSQHS